MSFLVDCNNEPSSNRTRIFVLFAGAPWNRVCISLNRRQFRLTRCIDVRNVLNAPYWSNLEAHINSLEFGKMLAAGITGNSNAVNRNGTRSFTFNARVNF